MEVLRCSPTHNKCHNLNYYDQSFTPPVKHCSNTPANHNETPCLCSEQITKHIFFSFCSVRHTAALFCDGEFNNICHQQRSNKHKLSVLYFLQLHNLCVLLVLHLVEMVDETQSLVLGPMRQNHFFSLVWVFALHKQ